MRHLVDKRKLHLAGDQRMALLKGLVEALFLNGSVHTTEARAKEVRRIAERLITLAKTDSVHTRREAHKWIQRPPLKRHKIQSRSYRQAAHPERDLLNKLFTEIAPRYQDREGGYTRTVKIQPRRGDAAPMAILTLVE